MKKQAQLKGATRRQILKTGAMGIAAIPLALITRRDARAQTLDLPTLTADDPQAQALGYVADASSVDASVQTTFVAGSKCSNCMLFTGGDAAMGPCSIFPGKLVNADGWCRTWVKKAG